MKVEELIRELEKFDGDLDVKTDNMYRMETISVSEVRVRYVSLDESYVYIG